MASLQYLTPDELVAEVGQRLKALRLDRRQSQATVAARAGVSLRSLQSLESGAGSTLSTYVRTLKALGQLDTLDQLAPAPTVRPMELLQRRQPRQRAPKRKPA